MCVCVCVRMYVHMYVCMVIEKVVLSHGIQLIYNAQCAVLMYKHFPKSAKTSHVGMHSQQNAAQKPTKQATMHTGIPTHHSAMRLPRTYHPYIFPTTPLQWCLCEMGIVVVSVSVSLMSESVGAWLWKVGKRVDYVCRCWTSEWLRMMFV